MGALAFLRLVSLEQVTPLIHLVLLGIVLTAMGLNRSHTLFTECCYACYQLWLLYLKSLSF